MSYDFLRESAKIFTHPDNPVTKTLHTRQTIWFSIE